MYCVNRPYLAWWPVYENSQSLEATSPVGHQRMIPGVKFSTQHNILQVIITIIMIMTHAQAIITSTGFRIKVFLLIWSLLYQVKILFVDQKSSKARNWGYKLSERAAIAQHLFDEDDYHVIMTRVRVWGGYSLSLPGCHCEKKYEVDKKTRNDTVTLLWI